MRAAHQAELNGKPEEAGQRFEDADHPASLLLLITDSRNNFRSRMRAVPESDQRIRELPVRMHGHMAGNVVEDVRLRQVVQPVEITYRDRCGKLAIPQTV